MCARCDDFARTVQMLGFLVLYAEQPGSDLVFADMVGGALAASLPDVFPPGYDPADGPEYPGEGWTP
ncbi:hypothetical protein ACFYZ2_21050 [Streptomyces sviceus]|uniref:hypothetical protein n=1 Tax=Streptomyces sviceus TaxID=285530 RepID=UPI00368AC12B